MLSAVQCNKSAAICENFQRCFTLSGVCTRQRKEDELIKNGKGIDWTLHTRDRNKTCMIVNIYTHTHTHTASTSKEFQCAVAIGTEEGNGHVLEMWRGEGIKDGCVFLCVCVCCRGGLGLIIALILNLSSHCHQHPLTVKTTPSTQVVLVSNNDAKQVWLNHQNFMSLLLALMHSTIKRALTQSRAAHN